MSFSCPHFDDWHDSCRRVGADCVPGRPGCVLRRNSGFAVPVEERIRDRKEVQRPGETPNDVDPSPSPR